MAQKRHIMHGRDHLPGGADPIGTAAEVDLSRYVLAAALPYRNLWVGGHTAEDSGAGAMTAIACPLSTALAPAPVANKFYNHGTAPVTGPPSMEYLNNLGTEFIVAASGVELTGVQFWRQTGSGSITVRAWDGAGTLLASKTAVSGFGWNEFYFDTPVDTVNGENYIVGWYLTEVGSVAGSKTARSSTVDGVLLANNGYPSNYSRHDFFAPHGPDDMPDLYGTADYLVGPILNFTPEPPHELYIVATAREDTDPGVHVVRTEPDDEDGVINIFWSAADAQVAVNVFVMAYDPGDTGCETFDLLGRCTDEDEATLEAPVTVKVGGPPEPS